MRRALILDRDGVINRDLGYVHRREDFIFIDGIFDLCRAARDLGMAIVVITNQAGIGRGYYSEADYLALNDWMRSEFLREGISIDAVYHCPFHPEHGIGDFKRDSYDRKPNPGMILTAQRDLGLDLARSVLIGDKPSDIEAGRSAGVGVNALLLSGVFSSGTPDDLFIGSLAEAISLLG